MMKRIVLLLTLGLVPAWGWALNVTVQTRPTVAGGTTAVRLQAEDAVDLGYIDVAPTYDWAQLTLITVEPAPQLRREGVTWAVNPETVPDSSGVFRFAVTAPAGLGGTVELADLVFSVSDSVREDALISWRSAQAVDTKLRQIDVALGADGRATITAVAEEKDRPLSLSPALLANVPNSFNASTLIPFQLARRGAVR